MKKLFVLLFALLLCSAPALAETREAEIMIEGELESVVETLYQSNLGFYFWYDAEQMEADGSMSESGESLLVSPLQSDLPIYLEIMTPDAVEMLPWKFLEINAKPHITYNKDVTESGAEIYWFSKQAEHAKNTVLSFYAVNGTEDFVVAAATCPMEAMEGWGERFIRLVRTIGFGQFRNIPIRAVWASEAGSTAGVRDTVVATSDEDAAWVVFFTDETVSDFRLLELESGDISEDGLLIFNEQVIYSRDKLMAGESLRAALTFYGDIPNNGISFTDAQGLVHRYALSISGFDGTLELTAY